MALLLDNPWECDYHISYVISLLDKEGQLQCSTANVGNQYSDWLVNEAAPSGWDQLGSPMRRMMPHKREEKPATTKKLKFCRHPWENSIDATVQKSIQAHYKYTDFRQIMAITNSATQLVQARLAIGHITSKHTFTRLASRKINALYSANDRLHTRHLHVCKHQPHQGECTEHRRPPAASNHLPDSTMHDSRTNNNRCWMECYNHSMFLQQYIQS